MAWGNMEVESVELGQDMSYEALANKVYEKYRNAGFLDAYREILSDFDIAIMASKKCKGNFYSIMLQCEDSLNIIISSLFVSLDILESCLGYSILKSRLIEVLECIYKNDGIEDKMKFWKLCEEFILEEINNLKFWNDKESLKKAEKLSYYIEMNSKESIFKLFVDSVAELVRIANEAIRHHYGRCDKKMLNVAVNKTISYYAREMNNGKNYFFNVMKKLLYQFTNNLDNAVNRDKINHPFVSVVSEIERGW